ncbi:polysaccharide lyase 8 family protein [Nonomuraea sp. MCN248]|uniref:Polysaccharide lyase 8 family protein n=1 Tax=Nonomuraea corallina TaxID=2989783 RepID=A0ABT4S4W0_9ACTN|nr:polysaccharide lyase 8 family protein [Nonomuraea corallina]MDA0632185.1 polysaccharide lyase 8 family protein [Nonomuraea corallina]
MAGWSRRAVLRLGVVAAAVPEAGAGPVARRPYDPGAFAAVRRRWREVTVDPAHPVRAARRHLAAMAPTDGHLWPDLPYPSLSETPGRLLAMARAYVVSGDAGLRAGVASGVDHFRRHVYAAGAEPVGNWWHWEIGAPARLLDAAVLVGLSGRPATALGEAVDHFVPPGRLRDYSGTSTAANRVDLCLVTLLRAVLGGDAARADLAVRSLTPVFRYVTEGDGFYRDGSFLQHGTVPYQGGYGLVLLEGLATLFAVLRGTPWQVTDPNRQVVYDSVERSFAPFVHAGHVMDLVSGRGIGRSAAGGEVRARRLARAVRRLAVTATPEERRRWRPLMEGRGAQPPGHRLFPMSARAVHRAPGWCAALSMSSDRIAHYEHGNGENLRGWHTGSGMLYWWGEGHAAHYADGFWATVDPYRLPGTTVSTRRLPDGAGEAWGGACPPFRWVGGATDGRYATVGHHLRGLESTVEAFKSWFFLDDAVVCLGAGISGGDGAPVETIVDNRRSAALLTVHDEDGWAHLAGHGGYVVRDGGGLHRLREHRAGGGAARPYVTLWLDHGLDPDAARYAYLLLPNATLEATRARAADPGWARTLANTASQQGVHVPSAGVTAVNFWQPGSAGPLSASGPCAVLVTERGDGSATVTVSDPRRDLTGLTVTWDRPVPEVTGRPPALLSAGTGRRLTLTFAAVPDSATVTVRTGDVR